MVNPLGAIARRISLACHMVVALSIGLYGVEHDSLG